MADLNQVAAQHAVDLALNAFGGLDVLVNNAGKYAVSAFSLMMCFPASASRIAKL
jgi:NAD(P)-dependent dehydrogenase (short-subunit alcohol dehydrogenase family)